MTDFNKPDNNSNYSTGVWSEDLARITAVSKMDYTSVTNIPTNAIRWNSTNNYFEKYNGSTWAALTSKYLIDVDTLDGYHAGNSANQIPYLDGTGRLNIGLLSVNSINLYGPTTVTNTVSSQNIVIARNASDGNIVIGSNFDIASAIGAAWESVGDTASGATNIWAALDNVPSSAVAIIVRVRAKVIGASTATAGVYITQEINARAYGGSATNDVDNLISYVEAQGYHYISSTYRQLRAGDIATSIIPIDSSARFELYRYAAHFADAGTASGTYSATMALTGWVE